MKTTQLPNRLIDEKSPYLLQHAYNPVKWYPWGEEAFNKAEQENKPVFLSIGYSTCHWCHVMERESFEDEEVARLLNQHFVAVKVDREERPDIDTVYMNVCQGMTGHGGWPLTIIMTPDKKPFFAATYIPKYDRRGLSGMMTLLPRIAQIWQDDRPSCYGIGDRISDWLIEASLPAGNRAEIKAGVFDEAFQYLTRVYDSEYGGFGSAPKFPTPHNLYFLLRYWYYTGEELALEMVEQTLKSMYKGGIYDHIGFGFARYSTDRAWLVPHFEKMLYDNALLAVAFVETYQATGNEFYADVAREIFTYVMREMTSPEGGFYSAQDADSEGEEGKFYVWTAAEIMEVLGEFKGMEFCSFYGIAPEGNFEGKSIPNLLGTELSDDERRQLEPVRLRLFNHRSKRIAPFKDDKILLSWNGFMIAALALGGRVLDEPSYIEKARTALTFIETRMRVGDRYMLRYRQGEAANPALAEDYAALVWGLLEVYRSTLNPAYLQKALEVNSEMINLFWDEVQSGLYYYGKDSEELLINPKEVYDGSIPSPNSLAARNLVWLGRLTGDQATTRLAELILKAFSEPVSQHPWAHTHFLLAAMTDHFAGKDIVIAGDRHEEQTRDMISVLNQVFRPDITLVLKTSQDELVGELVPFGKEMKKVDDRVTAYICEGFSCREPVFSAEQLCEAVESSPGES
jgi:hypothetical protein